MRPEGQLGAEDVFEAANASNYYRANRKPKDERGFQISFAEERRQIGGWNNRERHWHIQDAFACNVPNHRAILREWGFSLKEKSSGHKWWQLNGEAEGGSFCGAVKDLTGKPIYFGIPGEERCETYPEGQMVRVAMNRYERDPRNRQRAIKRHGTRCRGCGLEMAEKYGEVAKGYIQIHHTEPVSQVDPNQPPNIDTLIPLCPNCHAVVHLCDPPLTEQELQDRISTALRR